MKYDPNTLRPLPPESCPSPALDPWPNAHPNDRGKRKRGCALLRLMRASNPSPHTIWICSTRTTISQVLSRDPNHRIFSGLSLFEGMHLGLGCFVFEERKPSQWWVELRDTGHPLSINGVISPTPTPIQHGALLAFNGVAFRFEQHTPADLALESTMEFSDDLVQEAQQAAQRSDDSGPTLDSFEVEIEPAQPPQEEEPVTAPATEDEPVAAPPKEPQAPTQEDSHAPPANDELEPSSLPRDESP